MAKPPPKTPPKPRKPRQVDPSSPSAGREDINSDLESAYKNPKAEEYVIETLTIHVTHSFEFNSELWERVFIRKNVSTTENTIFLVKAYEDFPSNETVFLFPQFFTLYDVPPAVSVQKVYKARSFKFTSPSINLSGVPKSTIEIDNVDFEEGKKILDNCTQPQKMDGEYRAYLNTNKNTPLLIIPFQINTTSINKEKIILKVSFSTIEDRPFPARSYSQSEFPGLSRG